jgi:hypothetical protein
MKHSHPSILVLMATALFIGVSISAGPVVWAVLVMVSPLVVIMIWTSRGAAHGNGGMSHAAYVRSGAVQGGADPGTARPGDEAETPEARRAAMLHDRERMARVAAEAYTQAHLND